MDPPPAGSSRRRASGTGGRGRGESRLGMKTARSRAPSPSPASSPASSPIPTPSLVSALAAPTDVTSTSSTVPARPPQGVGWEAIRPNLSSVHGNREGLASWMYPPGGFVNFMQQPFYPPQPQEHGVNFHLVGQNLNFNPISPPPPSTAQGAATSQGVKRDSSTKERVNIDIDEDDNNEASRTAKKRYWSHEEEERLASSWLNASKDPIKGNDKKGDTFWQEVTDEFNKKGNGKRRRETNQMKIHWSRLKSSITDFNDAWTKFQETEKNKNDIVDVPDEQSRPIGREAAKAERNGKRKKENIMEGIVILGDNIEKIVKVQEDRKLEREKVTEAQIQISNTNLKVAKENKEAKMFEVYNSLLNQDTSQMSENQKANRDRAIQKIEEKLFAE